MGNEIKINRQQFNHPILGRYAYLLDPPSSPYLRIVIPFWSSFVRITPSGTENSYITSTYIRKKLNNTLRNINKHYGGLRD